MKTLAAVVKQANKCKKPNLVDWASGFFLWLPDLGSNQGPTD